HPRKPPLDEVVLSPPPPHEWRAGLRGLDTNDHGPIVCQPPRGRVVDAAPRRSRSAQMPSRIAQDPASLAPSADRQMAERPGRARTMAMRITAPTNATAMLPQKPALPPPVIRLNTIPPTKAPMRP